MSLPLKNAIGVLMGIALNGRLPWVVFNNINSSNLKIWCIFPHKSERDKYGMISFICETYKIQQIVDIAKNSHRYRE